MCYNMNIGWIKQCNVITLKHAFAFFTTLKKMMANFDYLVNPIFTSQGPDLFVWDHFPHHRLSWLTGTGFFQLFFKLVQGPLNLGKWCINIWNWENNKFLKTTTSFIFMLKDINKSEEKSCFFLYFHYQQG